MRLRKPCEHDFYDPHWMGSPGTLEGIPCPGGEFLPEDALVIEKDADGEWPKWATDIAREWFGEGNEALDTLAEHSALVDQVGEPG